MNGVKTIFLEIIFQLLNENIKKKRETFKQYFLSEEGAKRIQPRNKTSKPKSERQRSFPTAHSHWEPYLGDILVPRPSSRLLGGLPRGVRELLFISWVFNYYVKKDFAGNDMLREPVLVMRFGGSLPRWVEWLVIRAILRI